MKSSLSSGTYRPFKNLKTLLDEKSFPLASDPKKPVPTEVDEKAPDEEETLFQEVMADVVPILRDTPPIDQGLDTRPKVSEQDPEVEALARLEDLVRGGDGFIISDTAEYMEGLGYGVNREIAKRLHQGDFSIQVHLDLHGLSVAEAHGSPEDAFVVDWVTCPTPRPICRKRSPCNRRTSSLGTSWLWCNWRKAIRSPIAKPVNG